MQIQKYMYITRTAGRFWWCNFRRPRQTTRNAARFRLHRFSPCRHVSRNCNPPPIQCTLWSSFLFSLVLVSSGQNRTVNVLLDVFLWHALLPVWQKHFGKTVLADLPTLKSRSSARQAVINFRVVLSVSLTTPEATRNHLFVECPPLLTFDCEDTVAVLSKVDPALQTQLQLQICRCVFVHLPKIAALINLTESFTCGTSQTVPPQKLMCCQLICCAKMIFWLALSPALNVFRLIVTPPAMMRSVDCQTSWMQTSRKRGPQSYLAQWLAATTIM